MKLSNTGELKPYPKMKDSGVEWLGEVPTHWSITTLRRKLRPFDGIKIGPFGSQLKLEQMSESGYKVYGQANVISKDFTRGTKFVGQEKFDELSACEVLPGDLLVTMMGTSGRCAGVPNDAALGIMDSHLLRLRTDESISARFAALLIDESSYMKEQITVVGKGSIMHGLNSGMVKALFLVVPPLPEQTAIVRFLDHADRRIRRYIRAKQKLVALLEEQRKTATQEAIQSRSVSIHRLEVVADLIERPIDRVTTNRYTPIGLYNRGRGIFKKEPRSGGELGDSDFFWIEEGDLVLSGQFAWEGAIALAGDTESGCVASHRYPILRGRQDVLDSGFLLAFFQTDWGQLLLDHHSRGAAGRNRPLNARTLLREKIPLPPRHYQLQIVEMLQRETLVRQQAETLSRLLNEYRTRLIADVVTGKLDVREAAAALPEVDPLGAESPLGDTFDTDTELDSAELDATLEEANA